MKQKQVINKKAAPADMVNTSSANWKLVLLAAAVAIVTFLSFTPAQNNSFTNWDDNAYVFENKHLEEPLTDGIKYFFEQHYFIGNYVPLTMIVYAIEYHMVELDPPFYHKVNILFHLLNVVLVFWFIWLLSGKRPLVAAIVALFFGIHPMHVESVAWVAELKDVLYCFFFMAGLIAYYKYTEHARVKNVPGLLALAFIFFVLSMLSKPAAVVFPVVLLLVDFYNRRKVDRWLWIEKLPFFIVSIIFGIIAIKAQQADKLIHDYYPMSQRLLFASHSLLNYIVKLFLPLSLAIFHPYPKMIDGHLPYIFYVAPVVLLAVLYGIYKTLKYGRLIAFGFLFFFVNLLLVLQLLSLGDAIIADRYTYVPYIGLLFIIAMGFDRLYRSTQQELKMWKTIAAGAIVVSAILCSYLTYARCEVWENDDTLATDLYDKFPDDRLVLNNKGFILYEHKQFQESIPMFTRAIALKPDYIMAYINLANSYMAMRDFDNAANTIDTALKYEPRNFNLLNTHAYLLSVKGNYPEAIRWYEAAIREKKDNVNGYVYMAQCYFQLKDYNNSLRAIDTALAYDPRNFILYNNKGYTLWSMGNYVGAIECYKAALKIKPDYEAASINMAECYRDMNDTVKARK